MTNGGECLEFWMERLKSNRSRINFAVEMLRQIIPGLERLHSLGYSHGDLKLENICARSTQGDSCLKFTLIDFGMSKVFNPKANEKNNMKTLAGTVKVFKKALLYIAGSA